MTLEGSRGWNECRLLQTDRVLLGTITSVSWFGGDAMKNRPGRRKRQLSKRSASLTVEFLERRVVLDADPTGGVLIAGSPFEGQALTSVK